MKRAGTLIRQAGAQGTKFKKALTVRQVHASARLAPEREREGLLKLGACASLWLWPTRNYSGVEGRENGRKHEASFTNIKSEKYWASHFYYIIELKLQNSKL